MYSRLDNRGAWILAGAALFASLAFSPPAHAIGNRVTPQDTPTWGNDVVRVTSDQAATLDVGPSGGGMESSSGSGTGTSSTGGARRGGSTILDDTPSVDYCVDLAPTDDSSGPYRVFFHLDTGSGDGSSAMPRRVRSHRRPPALPSDGVANLSFEIDTAVEMAVDTTGGDAFLGAIYDDTDTLVASDTDAADRLSVTLASGSYTLVITGTGLTGNYVGQAQVGTCGGS